eukprot:3981107-Pleurochrysis_carterae.AAC.1
MDITAADPMWGNFGIDNYQEWKWQGGCMFCKINMTVLQNGYIQWRESTRVAIESRIQNGCSSKTCHTLRS